MGLRKSSLEDYRAGYRGGLHYHAKRHMLPQNNDHKKRMSTPKPRELRKKPSGHLKPLDEDDMENDEVVSVAVGPPPVRPKYDKSQWKHTPKQTNNTNSNSVPATNLVRDILTQLGQEFLTHEVSEDFVFGQYIGNAMRNLTSELRLKMQHEILELVVKYQKINRGDMRIEETKPELPTVQNFKDMRSDRNFTSNDNEESWPDFSNLAKIVGRK
ncbi:unnamed protein product [Diatraea saccharalis]|uniref:Uncharacterized protein n=1 Tax=Diatraea saccharalis TaxID=40085 RepID=A0A9N9WC58_9NEOP|nr:unnamed protein product [Diatraea saccharalis]